MLNKKAFAAFHLFEVIALLIFLVIICIFYLNQSGIGLFFNSDELIFPDVLNDLANHGNIKDWVIPSSPMFFPDWFIFFIIYFSTKNIYVQFLLVSCFNPLLMYLMIRLIYSEFFGKEKAIFFSVTSLSFLLFFSINFISPYVLLFLVGYHIGSFIIGLLYVFIQLKLLRKNNDCIRISILLFFSFLTALIMGASDPLFIVQFSFPVLLSYLLLWIKNEISSYQMFIYAFIPICFSVFGVILIPYLLTRSLLWEYLAYPTIGKIALYPIKLHILFIVNLFKSLIYFHWISYLLLIFYVLIFFFVYKKYN